MDRDELVAAIAELDDDRDRLDEIHLELEKISF
jgi:hypothetical protein